jgi:hypothetical protein
MNSPCKKCNPIPCQKWVRASEEEDEVGAVVDDASN